MEVSEEIKFSSMMPEKLDIGSHKAEDYLEWEKQWKDYSQFSVLDMQVCVVVLKTVKTEKQNLSFQ